MPKKPKLLRGNNFSKVQLAIFAAAFAAIGAVIFISFATSTLPGDINGDNQVNTTDASLLMASWQSTNSKCVTNTAYTCDINADGIVNILDASVLMSHWGQTASTSYDSTILNDGPVAYWAMNKTSSTETDLTGRGHTGTYKGTAPTLSTMPNGDPVDVFNGINAYLTVPSSADLSIPTTHQFTWEAWIRPAVLQWSAQNDLVNNGYVDFMGKCQDYSPTCEWMGRMYASVNAENRCNRISAYVFNPTAGLGSGADWQPGCNLLQAGQWLHIVGEYQTLTTPAGCSNSFPGSIDIWVNGVKWSFANHSPTGCMSQYNITPQATSSPFNIGTNSFDTWFPGAIGKVSIYNKLLSQSQINAHYTKMTGLQPSGSCGVTCTIP